MGLEVRLRAFLFTCDCVLLNKPLFVYYLPFKKQRYLLNFSNSHFAIRFGLQNCETGKEILIQWTNRPFYPD